MLSAADREVRRRRITSSTAAAILGFSPFMTPLQAWEEITGRAPSEPEVDEQTAAAFERGHVLEPALLEWARVEVSRAQARPLSLVRPSTMIAAPWAADSVDGVLFAQPDTRLPGEKIAALEAKTVSGASVFDWGEPGTDQVPDHVALQCRWHLWAHELPVCYVPALVGARLELRMYVVPRQADVEAALVETCEKWHHVHVVGDRPPEAQAGDEGVLRRLFPKNRGLMLDDDPAIAMLARRDVELREQIKAAEHERDGVRCELMERLGAHDGCRGDDYSVSWKAGADRPTVDWKALADALEPDPELVEKHTRVRPGTRVLRTSWTPKEDA